jgi:hypothetical protein
MAATRLIATALLATTLPLAFALPASAGDREEIRRGSCSGSTDWKIKASPDDGKIEVEAEIDSNVNGQTWRWVLRHDGTVADRGRKETRAPSGSFEVERKVANHDGTDRFRFRAVNPDTDEVCLARVRL